MTSSISEQIKLLSRGTTEIINLASLEKKLKESQQNKKPLKVKAGFDPTAPDIHLGHVVLLRKMKQFQDLGHEIYFLIGDFTALVGDPTGRDQLRPKMDQKTIESNAGTYKKQVFKILDEKKTKVVFNSDWLAKLKAHEMLELSAFSTVAQMLARADFKKRFDDGKEISLLEFIYPLLQGYDSVHLKADIELGGNDQKFNLLMGRQLQGSFQQDPQVVMMMPLLEGTDGVKKMSKSLNNYIGINEEPKDIFGKIMSISDGLMMRYYDILTDIDLSSIKSMHPKEAKMNLGQEIVAQFYDKATAEKARAEFEQIFSQGQTPEDIAEYHLDRAKNILLADVLVKCKLVASKNEFRRLVKQGSISIDGKKVQDENFRPSAGIVKVGKRRFLKLVEE